MCIVTCASLSVPLWLAWTETHNIANCGSYARDMHSNANNACDDDCDDDCGGENDIPEGNLGDTCLNVEPRGC